MPSEKQRTSSPRWAPRSGRGPLPALKAADGLQRLPHLCPSLLTPNPPRGAQTQALNSTSGSPHPAPAARTWLSAQLSDAPRVMLTPTPGYPHQLAAPELSLGAGKGHFLGSGQAWGPPRLLPSQTPHPPLEPAPRARCLNIPHLSESKRSGKTVRGGRWGKAPIPRSAARCPRLPTAPLLSGERLGGPSSPRHLPTGGPASGSSLVSCSTRAPAACRDSVNTWVPPLLLRTAPACLGAEGTLS